MVDASGNVLVLTQVEIVLRDIEFKRENHDNCDSVSTGNDDSCEEFDQFSVVVDTGVFDELELKIHKPEDDGDAEDHAFLAAHPDLEDVSIRVTGTFNGAAFTFVTDLNADEEFALNLVDPNLALKGGPLENTIKNNIQTSFDAFSDDDSSGGGNSNDD